MNTDKIWAESIAKDYAPKDNSKVIALKKLDNRAKLPAIVLTYSVWNQFRIFHLSHPQTSGTQSCLFKQLICTSVHYYTVFHTNIPSVGIKAHGYTIYAI